MAGGFLLSEHPDFSLRLHSCCDRVLRAGSQGWATPAAQSLLIDEIYRTIEPFDVAGLCDRRRRNWHPVTARDLLNASFKLGVGQEEINQLLDRCGFHGTDNSAPAPMNPAALQGTGTCDNLSA